ncbi:MAG: hypothetical protein ACRDNG_05385 [Gaiellaceae bacterium]
MAGRNTHEEARALITSDEEQLQTIKLYAERRTAFILSELDRRGLLPIYEAIARVPREGLDWPRAGVSDADAGLAESRGVEERWLHRVFCHSTVIAEMPGALAYYRNLAGISGKAQGRTLPRLRRIETGAQSFLEHEEVLGEISALNEVLRRALHDPLFSEKVIDPLLFVGEGASIDGVWRNIIGKIAVWEALRHFLAILQDADQFVRLRIGRRVEGRSERQDLTEIRPDQIENLEREGWTPLELEGRHCMVQLPANPDVEIFKRTLEDEEWVTVAAGEIKGATDPANVWERWPLVIKTLDDIKSTRPTAERFFIGLTITENLALGLDQRREETRRGIKQLLNEGLLTRGFSLSKLLTPSSAAAAKAEFEAYFRPLLIDPE